MKRWLQLNSITLVSQELKNAWSNLKKLELLWAILETNLIFFFFFDACQRGMTIYLNSYNLNSYMRTLVWSLISSLGECMKKWVINDYQHSDSPLYAKLLQSCPTLWDPIDCSPPGSSVHGIFQARILEWVALSFSTIFLYFLLILRNCYRKALAIWAGNFNLLYLIEKWLRSNLFYN